MARRVSELMQRGAVTCTEDRSIREVAQTMIFNRLRYCVIVRGRNEVQGIISARSILKALGRNLDRTKAKDILLPYTVTATPATPLTEAIKIMSDRRIEHLIIVSDRPGSKAVLGILSAAEIVQSMAKAKNGKERHNADPPADA